MSFQATGEVNQVGELRVEHIVARIAGRALALLGMAIATLALAAAGLLAAPQAASAETFYSHLGELGGAGSADGEFGFQPSRIAVHEQSGKLLVADTPNDRVQVFDPVEDESDPGFPATHELTVDELDGGDAMSEPIAVAIDQDTGDAYVALAGALGDGGTIARFEPDDGNDPTAFTHDSGFDPEPFEPIPGVEQEPGSFGEIGAANGSSPNRAGLAVDPSGDVLLLDPDGNSIWRYMSDGSNQGQFTGSDSPDGAFAELMDLAVNSAGDAIVVDAIASDEIRIERFDDANDWQETITPAPSNPVVSNFGAVLSVDRNTDEVFVSSKPAAGNTTMRVHQFEYDPDAAEHSFAGDFGVPEDFADGDRFDGAMYGMAVRGTDPGRFYALATPTPTSLGGTPAPRIQTFEAIIPPEVSFGEIGGVTATEASFTGSIGEHGDRQTDWRFDYRTAGAASWEQVTDPDESPLTGAESLPVAVATDADDLTEPLDPNTDYEVRLCADNGVEVCTATEDFRTDPAAPDAETGQAWSVTATAATLAATINPRNSETEYYFEYGTDPDDYDSQTAPASVGEGGSAAVVTTDIEGLDPGTTYHFRVVATNVEHPGQELGDTGDDATFEARPASESELPERGYELVSHVDNNGVAAWPIRGSSSGDAYVTTTAIPATGAENGSSTLQRMTRDPDGSWSADPHMPNPPVDSEEFTLGSRGESPLLSDDLSLGLFRTGGSYDPMDQNRDGGGTGQDIYTRSTETGEMTWLSRADDDGPQTDPANAEREQYLSPDGSVALFRSNRQLDPEGHDPGADRVLYMWKSGDLSVVSIDDEGDTVSNVDVGAGSHTRNAVSPDGERIVFSEGSSDPTYIRDTANDTTVEIGGGDDIGQGEGSVYFGADAQTTEIVYVKDEALYLYKVGTEESTEIASPLATPVENSSVFDVSEDADRIYFSSPEELTPEAGGGDRYLYLAERQEGGEHEIRFVSALHPDDFGIQVPQPAADNDVDADAAGSVLAFTSVEGLVPGRRTGGYQQVYVYERKADRLYCASCPPDGSEPAGRGDVGAKVQSGRWLLGSIAPTTMPSWRNVSESGSVFFQSEAPLVPGDGNAAIDTYEWRGGELRLISSGRGTAPQFFADASADGETLFFRSKSDFVDHGGVSGISRIYAARVGGGFEAPEREVDCTGNECRGEAEEPKEITPGTDLGAEPSRSADPPTAVNQRRCLRLARHARGLQRRAVALRRVARRAGNAQRRRAAVKRFRPTVKRMRVVRRQALRCRRAVR